MRPRSPFSNAESSKKCNHNPAPTPRSSCGVDALCFFRIVKDRNSLGSKTKRQRTLRCARVWFRGPPTPLRGYVGQPSLLWLASRSCEAAKAGGGERDRTDDLLLAKQALSQLSYTPGTLVGLVGFEPTTPALSRRCSNRLSYRPPTRIEQPRSWE